MPTLGKSIGYQRGIEIRFVLFYFWRAALCGRGEMTKTELLRKLIDESSSTVFFGGAGVSVASGIPDFRGTGGLYTECPEDKDPPEVILRGDYLFSRPRDFYSYYVGNMLYPYAEPNPAHRALAALERCGKLSAVITQNIDGLHQQAGSERVIELHGSVERNYCTRCQRTYSRDFIIDGAMSIGGVPRCECGGTVRPDVTLYGEALDTEKFYDAEELIAECELLIVGGTSLTVNPAASLIEAYMGERLVIINKSPTPYDDMAYLIIRENIEDVLSELV